MPSDGRADRFGFRTGERGTHGSRSMMLGDLVQLLDANPVATTYEVFRASIMDDNVLGKHTASTRFWTWKKLRELYGLDPQLPVFRCFRQVWESDAPGRPLLALLCACARDPLLRMSAPTILELPLGTVVTSDDLARAMQTAAPDRFRATTLRSMGGNLLCTWTQGGYLSAGKERKRAQPLVTAATTAYALLLGRLTGARGQLLFSTFWTDVLDAPTEQLIDLAAGASRQGWVDLRRIGSVVEVGFGNLLTAQEEEALRGLG